MKVYLILAKKQYENPRKFSGAWNFGTEAKSITDVKKIVEYLIEFWGSGSLKVEKTNKFYEQHNLQLDIKKAKKELKWKPTYNIKDSVKEGGKTLLFSHGYAIVYGETEIPQNIDIVMVAPSGGGRVVRTEYQKGFGVPALVAIENDFSGDAMRIALSYAKAIGSSKAAVFLSTFKEEKETDLFGEQVLLTGSIPLIIIESYKVLLEEGYDPVVSWFVCFYEIRTIVDLMFEKGLMSFYDDPALFLDWLDCMVCQTLT